ncbi:MAG: hypothetical protein K6G29_06080 [Clostridiales bacterium]|nr:hypothetical protein [Clostridiales bacterium]
MSIFLAAALTVLIEVPFLALCGYRQRDELAVAALTNLVTNLTLNLLFRLGVLPYRIPVILAAEALVVLAEYGIYALAFGRSGKLFFLTLAANALSFGIGVILFGI